MTWLGTLVVLFAIISLCFLSYRNSTADLEQLRTDGAPTTFAELDALQPKDDNAGTTFAEIAADLKGPQSRSLQDIESYIGGRTAFKPTVRVSMKALQRDIHSVRQASGMRNCFITPEQDSRLGSLRSQTPYIDQILVGGLLPEVARVECRAGNPQQALEDLADENGVQRLECQLPGYIASFESQWFRTSQFDTWAECVNKYRDRNSLTKALQIAKNASALPGIRKMLMDGLPTELAMMNYMCDHPVEWAKIAGNSRSISKWDLNPIAMGIAKHQFIHLYRLAVDQVSDDPDKWLDNKTVLVDLSKKGTNEWPLRDLEMAPLGANAKQCDALATEIAIQHLAISSAEVMLYKLQNGSFPDSLPNLGKDATDPFSGGPLLYRRQKNGFAIWSVGINKRDDGGVSSGPGLTQGADLVISFN